MPEPAVATPDRGLSTVPEKSPVISPKGPCRIDRVEVYVGSMPVTTQFSYGAFKAFPFTIVRLHSGAMHGVGETLVSSDAGFLSITRSLVGRDARALDTLLPEPRDPAERARFEAMSIALHDLVAQICAVPLYVLLGGTANPEVPLMPCIFPHDPEHGASMAQRFVDQGYGAVKIKLMGKLAQDHAQVVAIRRVIPDNIVLQGDANEGYTNLDVATKAVHQLGREGLQWFEDPFRGGVEAYRHLCKQADHGGARIMIDVLARRTNTLRAAVETGATHAVNIHPVQPGSIRRALHHVHMTQAFGVPVFIGGTGYTGVGTAAYQHLAAAVTPGQVCGELGGAVDHGMPQSCATGGPAIKHGRVRLTDSAGLGIRLNSTVLRDLNVVYHSFEKETQT